MPAKLTKDTQALLGDGAIDPKVQEALLSDPRVQDAMKKSGEQALNNPAVQDAIFKVAKENLTAENAAKVANSCKQWAQDPEVQAKARHYAGMAMAGAGQIGQQVLGCIEQGPDGIRFLCFVASLVSIGFACWEIVVKVLEFHALLVINGLFLMLFAFTTALFEAKPETIQKYSLSKYQDMLLEYAKFISTALGRGLFYIYQGMLWLITVGADSPLSWFQIPNLLDIILGGFFLIMGGFHIAMHYDIMPQEVVVKAKELGGAAAAKAQGAAGYSKVEAGP
jgi:hypothetical protein